MLKIKINKLMDFTVSVLAAIFLSRAALLGVTPTGLVTYSSEAIRSPYVVDRSDALVHQCRVL